MSDGCTGFAFFEWIWPSISPCCWRHDFGGSDGELLDCLLAATPEWGWAIVGFCVALMILLRPIYRMFRPKGTAKN